MFWDRESRTSDMQEMFPTVMVTLVGSAKNGSGQLKSCGCLVNAAGVSRTSAAHETAFDEWEQVIRVNLTGRVLYCRDAVLLPMDPTGCGIIDVASIAAYKMFDGRAKYVAVWAGLVLPARVMAIEWAARGIRVNSVRRGSVDTPSVNETNRAGWVDLDGPWTQISPQRLAAPAEIANGAVSLVGGYVGSLAGAGLRIDGSWLADGSDSHDD